ncbi:glycosyl transferase [Echinicola pacifica]|uniref:Glycosyl transferase n=1 Tax=Echinicola pacifica TaxID=346377 RepID=A0A918PLG6_9BACT|nr:glycosyltransferase family A protein [Echinicola pacifica]GGZ14987.1 glycosyl transferase [Echinicola pacifica]
MFSVVIPLYNKEDSVADTLASVLAQENADFEVVIVNDGSTDSSLDIVKGINDSRIKIFEKENGGVSSARNYGIAKSEFPYIAFMDADDKWKPNYLSEMSKLINDYPQAGMFTCYHCTIYNGEQLDMELNIERGILDNYFKHCLRFPIAWTSSTIVRKEVFEVVGGFPVGMVSGEDDYTWAKIALKYPVAFLPENLSIYQKEDISIISRRGKRDTCKETWQHLYTEDQPYVNKYIAMKAILKGKRYSWGGHTDISKQIEKDFKYVNQYTDVNHDWKLLFYLNRTPNFIKKIILGYKKAASKSNYSGS